MDSGIYAEDDAAARGMSVVEKLDPLVQVFARVHSKTSEGLSQKEIFQQTVEVVGESNWVDKGLAMLYLRAAIQLDFSDDNNGVRSLLEAAKQITGISFNSVEELGNLLDYEEHPDDFNREIITKTMEIMDFPGCPEVLKPERIFLTARKNTPRGFKWKRVQVHDKEITVTYARE